MSHGSRPGADPTPAQSPAPAPAGPAVPHHHPHPQPTSVRVIAPLIHRFAQATEAAEALAACVAQRLQQALADRGQALLVVSGGSTPPPFFAALRDQPLDWPRVGITLADERWLPPDHPDSNEALVRAHLLQGRAAAARFVPLKNAAPDAAAGQAVAEAALAALPWPADVVVLGVGTDGHTASLFPGDAARWWPLRALPPQQRCLAVPAPPPPNVACARLSLSPALLLAARCVLVHAVGAAKLAVLEQALAEEAGAGADADAPAACPVRLAWRVAAEGPVVPRGYLRALFLARG